MRYFAGSWFRFSCIVGGSAGVFVALWTEKGLLEQGLAGNRGVAALMGLFACIFGVSTWAGVELWREKPRAFRWAQILLIAQVPNLSFAGFAYHFYTGMTFCLCLSHQASTVTSVEFEFGSALKFQFGAQTEGFVLGVNLVAIVALYLLHTSRARSVPKEAFSASS